MRVFLTGATGYIGSALARRLAGEGHEVRAVVRPRPDAGVERTGALERGGVACFAGDVTDRYSLREAMSGADWVIHAAAVLDFRAPLGRMRRVNVEGTENVASLAYKLGVGRLLAVSSIAAWGGSAPDGSPSTEDSPPALPYPSAYSRTKHEADVVVGEWSKRGLAVDTVYPSLVYGPPAKRTGTNALLRAILLGRLPVLVGAGRLARWIHLDDLVEGIVRVLGRAEPGARYLLTGERATIGDVVRRVCELGGARPPRLRLSPGLATALLAVLGPLLRRAGVRGLPVGDQVRSLARHWNFDDAKARRELAWDPRPLAEGLPATVEHLRAI